MSENVAHDQTLQDTDTTKVLEASLCSIRNTGEYSGDIVIITDTPEMFKSSSLQQAYGAKLQVVPTVQTLTRVWFIKCKLLELLPKAYMTLMYMDSDIMVTAPLQPLFAAVPEFEDGYVGMFSDVTTRYGVALDDEKYHGGVVLLQREASESCCATWCNIMEGGTNNGSGPENSLWGAGEVMDDQIAMKEAVEVDQSCVVWFIPDHLQFVSDWAGMVFTPQALLAHFTHTARTRLKGRLGFIWRYLALSNARVSPECRAQAQAAYM
jgi:hypothetical protein